MKASIHWKSLQTRFIKALVNEISSSRDLLGQGEVTVPPL
jgi:hypothetical protein